MTFRSLAKTLTFCAALWLTAVRSAMALRASFLMQVTFMVLNNFAFFTFWWALFAKVPTIRGWALPDITLLYGLSASSFGVAVVFAGGALQLGRAIDEGELDALLAQPKPTLLYALGSRSHASGLGDLASGFGLIALSGRVSLAHVPYVALAVLCGGIVFAASATLYQSLTFWLGRSDALARQLWEATVTFSLYPEPLFRGVLRLVLFTLIPAGLIGYLPVRFVKEPTLLGAGTLIACALGYAALTSWVFWRGLRRYASGSRFGVFG